MDPIDVILTNDQVDELTALMQSCAEASYEDREWNAPVYDAELRVRGANGVNSHEATMALNPVAAILGIPGPSSLLDDMYGDTDA
jgi:hypothetical protein